MSLLEEFENIDINKIREYISTQQEEHLSLDFKTLERTEMSRGDRKNLAKAISGFANSNGGLIVWGVNCRENSDGIDCASTIVDIDNAKQTLSKLNEYTGKATVPIVEDVQNKLITTTDPRGILVTLVPESDKGPHMAKLGENRYYKRSGDSFYKMEHFDIADMFGKRKKPLLELVYSKTSAHSLLISIINNGRGSALAPYLMVDLPTGFEVNRFGVDGNHNWNLPPIHSQSKKGFGANTTFVIHPDTLLDVFYMERRNRQVISGRHELKYELACENMPAKDGIMIIDEP
jgi:hypothetical protein